MSVRLNITMDEDLSLIIRESNGFRKAYRLASPRPENTCRLLFHRNLTDTYQ